MSDDDLERFTRYFGDFGDDPFIAPIPGRRHVIAVRRRADETAPLFAENWHSDWSFQARRSEEHTSELQSLMRISYAVFCLTKKKHTTTNTTKRIPDKQHKAK